MRDKSFYGLHSCSVSCMSLLMLLLFSSSMHYTSGLHSPVLPQIQKMTKPSAKQNKRKIFQKKKSVKNAKRFSLKGFFRALGILGLITLLLSPLLLYLLLPNIAIWALFLAGMVSSAMLSIFFFALIFGSYKMIWFWFSLAFTIIFLACFVGLLITLPLFASLSIMGILLLIGLIGLFT